MIMKDYSNHFFYGFSHETDEIVSRVFTKLVNEAAFCLQEEIIRNPVSYNGIA